MRRSPLRWFGGKSTIADWVVQHLPPAHCYTEPFCGAANILFSLPRPYPVEIINDLDGRIVTFFRVLQDDDRRPRLLRRIMRTPYHHDEFCRALEIMRDEGAEDVERAWAVFCAQRMGFAGQARCRGNFGTSIRNNEAAGFYSAARSLVVFARRLRHVQIMRMCGVDFIRRFDGPDVPHYCDPPYHPEARRSSNDYAHDDATGELHERLVEALLEAKGMVVLSGFPCRAYAPLEHAGWLRVERSRPLYGTGPHKSVERRRVTEVIWLSPRAAAGLRQPDLFGAGAMP